MEGFLWLRILVNYMSLEEILINQSFKIMLL